MSGQVYTELSELQETISKKLFSSKFGLITIDGRDGSGKSTLASSLAKVLVAKHIEIDQYVNEHKSGYIKHIRFNELIKDFESSQKDYNIVIFEAVCILDITSKIGVETDISIYVKHIKDDFWYDGILLFNPDKNPDQHITDRMLSPDSLQAEIIRYHYHYMPHENSDIVFKRFD